VRVRLAVKLEAGPTVSDDVGVRNVDVRVLVNEVGADDGAEQLGRNDGVLLGEDEDGVFD
jgi:hypothetical protein